MRFIYIRFYAQLNDFLRHNHAGRKIEHEYVLKSSIKDIIESHGVPHTEVGLILVNGDSADWEIIPDGGSTISVYPYFKSIDVSLYSKMAREFPEDIKFVLDVHLGKLARYLRMAGFDADYENDRSDEILAEISSKSGRILLTRDIGLLKRSNVSYGHFVRNIEAELQLSEIFEKYNLAFADRAFTRCMACNGMLERVDKTSIINRLKPDTIKYFNEFYVCGSCAKLYWPGSHYENMKKTIKTINYKFEAKR